MGKHEPLLFASKRRGTWATWARCACGAWESADFDGMTGPLLEFGDHLLYADFSEKLFDALGRMGAREVVWPARTAGDADG